MNVFHELAARLAAVLAVPYYKIVNSGAWKKINKRILAMVVSFIILFGVLGLWGIPAFFGLIAIYWFFFIRLKQPSVQELKKKEQLILSQINRAEKKYFSHEITEDIYQQIVREKQEELVETEVRRRDLEMEKGLSIEEEEQIRTLEAKQRHLLKELLEKKQSLLHEIRVAREKYFKGQMQEQTYKEIVKGKQKELVETESKIAELYKQTAKQVLEGAQRKIEEESARRDEGIAKQIAEQVEQELEELKRIGKKR